MRLLNINKEKWDNYWYYYKAHTIVGIFLIFVIFITVSSSLGNKKSIFFVQMFGISSSVEKIEVLQNDFTKLITENPKETATISLQSLDKSTEATYMQKTVAMISAKELDIIVCDKDLFEGFAMSGAFKNLDDIPEIKSLAADSKLKLVQAAVKDNDKTTTGNYGINIEDSKVLTDAGVITKDLVLCIVSNTTKQDFSVKFIKYIFGEKIK